jgi:hypothetical protein
MRSPGGATTDAIALQLLVNIRDQSPAANASAEAAAKLLKRFAKNCNNPGKTPVYSCRGGKVITDKLLTWYVPCAYSFTGVALTNYRTHRQARFGRRL